MTRILVVDDEEWMQRFYEDELIEEGYEVITSGDGSKVLELIEQKRPDIVILDIKLGEYNGLDILQDIRNSYYDLPVILCTAYPAYKYEQRSIAADYYFVKRADLTELKIKIKMAMESNMQIEGNNRSEEDYETAFFH